MTPTEIRPTSIGFGFAAQLESMVVVHRMAELGAYLHYSYRPVDVVGTTHGIGTDTNVLSAGACAKLRLVLSDKLRARLGLLLGVSFETEGFSGGTIFGVGLNVGPTIELSYDILPQVAFTTQFGFVSQPIGLAILPASVGARVRNGQNQSLPFPPLPFLMVGIEFNSL